MNNYRLNGPTMKEESIGKQNLACMINHVMKAVDLYTHDIQHGNDLSWAYHEAKNVEKLDEEIHRWIDSPSEDFFVMAELSSHFSLSIEDVFILSFLATMEIVPFSDLYPINDIHDICKILSHGYAPKYELYVSRFLYDAPLRKNGLMSVSSLYGSDNIEINITSRMARIYDNVLLYVQNPTDTRTIDESLSYYTYCPTESQSFEALKLPEATQKLIRQMVRSKSMPALLTGSIGANKSKIANGIANLMGKRLYIVDLAGLLKFDEIQFREKLCILFRESKLNNIFIYFDGDRLPETIPISHQIVFSQFIQNAEMVIGVDKMMPWLVNMSSEWTQIAVPLPTIEYRMELWKKAYENDKRSPSPETIEFIARRYELSEAQIQSAASAARQYSIAARRKHIDLSDLDKSCRACIPGKISDLADLVPPSTFKTQDLVLPREEQVKFDEVLLYANAHDTIYSDWGFGECFPYGRGLSVLFYGPPGTGKTMAACIIANQLGLDLYRVDLSRIVNRYVGDTEKNIARIFDEAERGHVMLLFDEADSLFANRTAVRTTNDRYANLEVSYLLQRMENFEGVTVLTTNFEANLDDAFKRRLRYRIYFPMPDAATRTRLYESLLPKQAPVRKNIPFELLGNHFEISGGHIKQAVLKAAFYAKRDNTEIGLSQLVEASIAECRELGMLMNDNLPRPMTNAIRVEKGLPQLSEEEYRRLHQPVISQDLPLLDLPEGVPIMMQPDDVPDFR